MLAIGSLGDPGTAAAKTVTVLTYNTHGLPQPVLPDRTAAFNAMSPLLDAVRAPAIRVLQEVFDPGYYAVLTGHPYAYESPLEVPRQPESVGDGLTLFSDFPGVAGYAPTQWANCFGIDSSDGGDCLAEKGFSFARITLASGLEVDLYNLHADAGSDSGSVTARRANITQLITAINASSAGRAVIVAGDTNSLYTRGSSNLRDLLAAGFTDVWISLAKGGVVPASGHHNDSGCPPPRGTGNDGSGPDCELVDKIFFRSGNAVQITALDYEVLTRFVDGTGTPLSDHLPVLAQLDVSPVPAPALGLRLPRYPRASTRQ